MDVSENELDDESTLCLRMSLHVIDLHHLRCQVAADTFARSIFYENFW